MDPEGVRSLAAGPATSLATNSTNQGLPRARGNVGYIGCLGASHRSVSCFFRNLRINRYGRVCTSKYATPRIITGRLYRFAARTNSSSTSKEAGAFDLSPSSQLEVPCALLPWAHGNADTTRLHSRARWRSGGARSKALDSSTLAASRRSRSREPRPQAFHRLRAIARSLASGRLRHDRAVSLEASPNVLRHHGT